MDTKERARSWNFDSWAHRYDQVVATDQLYYACYDQVLEAVVEVAGIAPGTAVLDVGTGTGNLALRCLARGAAVVGLDPSGQMLAWAREKAARWPETATFQQIEQPFLHIPYPDASFDAVVSTYAYHHIPQQLKADSMREMVRVLRPGGTWALGDLAFEDEAAEKKALSTFGWLEEEYFSRIDELRAILAGLEMALQARQFTPVTWVLWAARRGTSG